MLLLTYSYVVPKEKRTEHARLLQRMRQVMTRLGCEFFEAYEQVGKQWVGGESNGRVVQILKFRDKAQFAAVQAAEKSDPGAQQLIAEFCQLVNLPYQQQSGMFAEGFYACLAAAAPTSRAPVAGSVTADTSHAAAPAVPDDVPSPGPEPDSEPEFDSKPESESEFDSEPESESASDSDALDYLSEAAPDEGTPPDPDARRQDDRSA